VTVVAVIRPDEWNFPLLLHVLGAMLLVGVLVLAASALILATRDGTASLMRLGFRSLLIGALPSWLAMRVGAEWIASKEHLTNAKLSWIDIGASVADGGFLVLLIATLLAGLTVRRAARAGSPAGLVRTSSVLVSLLVVAYVVAVWAMTTKPT
jgi:hypothetical protein